MSNKQKMVDYATPIWRCESGTDKAIRFFKEAVEGFALVGVFAGVLLGLAYLMVS